MKTLTPLTALFAVVGIVGGAGFSACNKKTEGPAGTAATGGAAPQGSGLMIQEVKAGEGALATKGKTVTIAMLDEHAGSSVGALRHNGFLKGFGIKKNDKQIACVANGGGQQTQSQPAMENCLQKNPNIDVLYTINEPSAAGAWTALKNAGKKASGVTIVSVDGGCAGVRNVKAGIIDATSQQYPLRMASLGVAAVVKFANGGAKASGYTDTGLNLIAKKPLKGVPSKSVTYGLANCWG